MKKRGRDTSGTKSKYAAEFRRIREDAGLTQGELARAAGMQRAYISQVETGTRHAFTVTRTSHLYGLMRNDSAWLCEEGRALLALAAIERGIDAEALEECDLDGLQAVMEMVEALPGMDQDALSAVRNLLKECAAD